jgi:vancomycin resistance protein VanJ
MKKRYKLLHAILKTISFVVMVCLWMALLAIVVPPHYFPLLGLATLALPFFFIVHTLFTIWYIIRGKRYVWSLLLTLFFVMPSFHKWISFGQSVKNDHQSEELRVLTYNVRMFNIYEWIRGIDVPQRQKELIEESKADIVALQEYYKYEKTPQFNYPYQYIHYSNEKENFGLAILSNKPIVEKGAVEYEHVEGFNNSFIYADIVFKTDTFRCINTHLASFYFDVKDFERLKQTSINAEEIQMSIKSIVRQLFKGFNRRSKQLKTLSAFIKSSPHPVILCGDMNDTPASYTYRVLNRHLEDAFAVSGRGVGRTYVETWFPLRIDWIFFPDVLYPADYQVLGKEMPLSDHLPVRVTFRRIP